MTLIRRSPERGRGQHGWLDTRHTFSFADYQDPAWMGFGPLRVINEDRVAGGAGFGTHPHRDMEILTWVLSGALEHRDSLGHRAVLKPGELQHISAGTGIQHSEYNYSPVDPVHFLQIWLFPSQQGLTPSYRQQSFAEALQPGGLVRVASGQSRDGAIPVAQDAEIYVGRLAPDTFATVDLAPGRRAWIQVARGEIRCLGETLAAGDGMGFTQATRVPLAAGAPGAEVLVFDLN